jgi:cytidylate kinase
MTEPFTVAIDGPAASGKGTISRAVAAEFGFAHLDTGLLYRAVGAKGGDPAEAARSLTAEDLKRGDLRTAEAGQAASRVAADPEVREALVDFQRAFARRAGGAVLDGRDIGTVICPEAEVKLYVTASDEVRARRRHAELAAEGSARRGSRRGADETGGRCALARHDGIGYSSGRRRGGGVYKEETRCRSRQARVNPGLCVF